MPEKVPGWKIIKMRESTVARIRASGLSVEQWAQQKLGPEVPDETNWGSGTHAAVERAIDQTKEPGKWKDANPALFRPVPKSVKKK